jgi:hypothetical protein
VIISKYGKSYDTADGSEQQFDAPASRVQTAGQAARQRWEDDGGPLYIQPPVSAMGDGWKPAWSVLSLRDLNQAIRREREPDSPERLRQEADRAERQRERAIRAEEHKAAESARAERDRYRNAWEHT